MRSNIAREDTNKHDDTSMNNILNDSYDETRRRDSPESVSSMYNQRVRKFERDIDRQKMCPSVRTNFISDNHVKIATSYRTACISTTKNYNSKQFSNNAFKYNSSMHNLKSKFWYFCRFCIHEF